MRYMLAHARAPEPRHPPRETRVTADLLLHGGEVVDGSGAPAIRADVAVRAGRIVAVGDLGTMTAAETLDCRGWTITPGFIDVHSHADFVLPEADAGALVEPFVRQGMTTLVAGNCGFSPAPLTPRSARGAREASRLMRDTPLEGSWSSMGEYLDTLAATGVPLNLVQLVGHGAVRAAVTGGLAPAPPTPEQLRAMERLTRASLDAGAFGASVGLGYAPGIFAREPELTAFARWAAEAGTSVTAHLRAYSRISPAVPGDPEQMPHNLEAIAEMLRVATAARARLQISHLIFVGRRTWPTVEQALALIEQARADGLDVAFDAFPYTAGNTTAAVLFPPDMLPHLETVLESPDGLAGLRAMAEHVFAQIGFGLEDIQIMHANAPRFVGCDGCFVPDAAARLGLDPWELYARLVVESRRTARVLIHTYSGAADDETALRRVLAHPLCTIETDTILTAYGHQNPASYGTFPRVLSTYVAAGLFTFEEAVHRMTLAPAARFGLRDRGIVQPGAAADLVVLDRRALRDTATFVAPARYPTGIEHVFINGQHVLDGDRYDAVRRAGAVLRR